MFLEYGFHPWVQRWVIGQCLCADRRSLASYGVHQDGDTAFLYLLSARHARLTQRVLQRDQESALLLLGPASLLAAAPPPPLPAASANGPSYLDGRPYSTLPPRLHGNSRGGGGEGVPRLDVRDLLNIGMPQLKEALAPKADPAQVARLPPPGAEGRAGRPGKANGD